MRKRGNPSLVIGLVLTLLVASLGIIGVMHSPYDPEVMNLTQRFNGPSLEHPFGTDHFGRDMLSRVMMASGTALSSALVSVTLGALAGIALGTLAAIAPRWLSTLIMRLVDALMAFPTILLALMAAAILGRGLLPSVLAVCISMVPSFSRLTQAMILEGRERLSIKAARAYGAPAWRIILFHLFPPVLTRLVTQFTSAIGGAVLLESSLSFLGLGVQPPSASLGMMLSEARAYLLTYPWQVLPSGITLLVLVLGLNLLGDGLGSLLTRRSADGR